ncbi:hypothetical protein Dsin_006653 [Dipteronia sinensis]|uniref:NADH-quinone oxidoreductase subunit D domain-containing protein n=1 Tax=Dipteronia sinensis TaxID=43782 RepID=A0AAE0EFU3_9ROSI|nr:hypothetical protein Dsin_006653 [Dipteronia sinensis]
MRLPLGLCRDIDSSTQQFASRIDELEEMSTGNRIWKQRLVDIGTVTAQQAKDWGFSGVMLRGRAFSFGARRGTLPSILSASQFIQSSAWQPPYNSHFLHRNYQH